MMFQDALPARLLLTIAIALAVPACSAPVPPTEDELVLRATRNFEEGDYIIAVDDYDELLEQFPFSDHAEPARLRIAHAYYLARQYDKAIESFSDFERLHPTSPHLAFVEYTVGMAYLDQSTVSDRDKTASENALRQFGRVRDRYPDSLYGRLAVFQMKGALENLALHELAVGDFYLSDGHTKAARARFNHLIIEYPTTETASTARDRLAEMEPDPEPETAALP